MEIEKNNPSAAKEQKRKGQIYGTRGGFIRDPKFRSVNVEEVNFQGENINEGLAGNLTLNRVTNGSGYIDMAALGPLGEFTLTGSIIPAVDAGGIGLGSYLGAASRAYGFIRSYFYSTASDSRLKKDVKDIEYNTETILKLRPVSFLYKKGEQHRQLGFIAQEVKEHVPEIVDGSEDTYYGVSYDKLVPVLVKTIQELNERIKKLEDMV